MKIFILTKDKFLDSLGQTRRFSMLFEEEIAMFEDAERIELKTSIDFVENRGQVAYHREYIHVFADGSIFDEIENQFYVVRIV